MFTPDDIHHGRAERVLEHRRRTLQEAWTQNPQRFVRGPPKVADLPDAVWINPPTEGKSSTGAHQIMNNDVSMSLTGSASGLFAVGSLTPYSKPWVVIPASDSTITTLMAQSITRFIIKRGLATTDRTLHTALEDVKPDRAIIVHGREDRFPKGAGVEAMGLSGLLAELAAAG